MVEKKLSEWVVVLMVGAGIFAILRIILLLSDQNSVKNIDDNNSFTNKTRIINIFIVLAIIECLLGLSLIAQKYFFK